MPREGALRVEIHRLLAGAVATAFVLHACGSPIDPRTASPSPSIEKSLPTSTAAVATPSPLTETPTPVPPLAIADLPRIELQTVDATAVCDPQPNQADIDAGETTVFCSDGIALALAVVQTVTKDPVSRLYLRRPTCASARCSEDELSTAEVTAWTATQAFAVQLDSRLETVVQPSVVDDDAWPAAGNGPAPAVGRPSIKGAPREVAQRDTYPFCGRAELGEPPDVGGCFRDAVLAGRRVEMVERVYGIEGGEVLWIYRYDGDGRLIRYQHDQSDSGDGHFNDTWRRDEGAMILGITSQAWDFDPWWGTELKP
jgi:hypothetical protein